MKDATIYEVAARAGVSISTVSLAINRPEKVSAATRQKVLAAADELGFVPKEAAVIKARKGVGRIGVVAPFTSYLSFARRLNGVLAEVGPTTQDVVVFDHESAASSPSPLLDALPMSGRLDGLIVMGLPLHVEATARLQERGLPTVLVDTTPGPFSSVTVDDERGGHLVGRHLTARDHRRIACLHEAQRSLDYVSQGQRRIAGVRRAVVEAGGSDEDVLDVVVGDGNAVQGAEQAVEALLGMDDPPAAVFAHYDDLAAGVVRALRTRGRRVPEDVAVVGYDDGPLAEALGLTTVRQSFEDSGRIAARLLLEAMRDPSAPTQQVSVNLELVVRDTA